MLTDSQIKAAIKDAKTTKKRVEVRDDGDRGGGRLLLVVRPMKKRIATEWYALYYRDDKRRFTKIGIYPEKTLQDAREIFRTEYAPTIKAGAQPENRFARLQHTKGTDITVRGLFEAYVADLERQGKKAWYQANRILLKRGDNAADALGADRAARLIESETIVAYLAAIHERGVLGMAVNARAYIGAAYAFAIRSEHNYTRKDAAGKWGIKVNPVDAIPTDTEALKVGERFLSPAEFRDFWRWLTDNEERGYCLPALKLIMATGQRVMEIIELQEPQFDRKEKMLFWPKTKNGLPHSLPLPEIAVELLESIETNAAGYFFPHRYDPDRPAIYTSPNKWCAVHAEETGIPQFTPRDLRRTWKTLAGRAGVSKEMRDRFQNHVQRSDVSTRHYDRYDYLRERRAAMKQWNSFMMKVLSGALDEKKDSTFREAAE